MLPIKPFLQTCQCLALKVIGVSKITLLGLYYPSWCGRQIQTKWGKNFERRDTNEKFNIRKGPLGCKPCQCRFPFVGSTKTKFRYRMNNCKWSHRKFRKKYVEKDLTNVIKKSDINKICFMNTTFRRSPRDLKCS